MPDNFPESPYADDPHIHGASLLTGHARFAGWFAEVDHPRYQSRMASYREMTERLNGIPPATDFAPTGRPAPGTEARVSLAWRPKPPEFPPISTQVGNLARAVGRQARAAIKGKPLAATPEQKAERLATCEACPNRSGNRCALCGCGLSAKAGRATERCPIGKWATSGDGG